MLHRKYRLAVVAMFLSCFIFLLSRDRFRDLICSKQPSINVAVKEMLGLNVAAFC